MPDQTKIGFNPEDRFMMTIANTLVVVRNDGSVFGSDVVNGQAQPVFEFGGAKIGFNPQDRFMMAVGNTLVVVTQDGSVFGSDVVNRRLQPVFQFGGAKIGFNPQDRFMMTLGSIRGRHRGRVGLGFRGEDHSDQRVHRHQCR